MGKTLIIRISVQMVVEMRNEIQLEVTWYKIRHTEEQKNVTRLHWEM